MRVGMLWFDDSTERNLEARVKRAAKHYTDKYGVSPTLCYVHPTQLTLATPSEIDGIEVRGTNMVLLHHLWLGREADND